jgi:hypothetical protein
LEQGYLFTISLLININKPVIHNLKLIIMKKLFFFLVFLFATANSFSQVYVQGYTRSNGTNVQGYYRTAPNSTKNDNYSTIGNTNPYTGTAGTQARDGYTTTSSYTEPTYNALNYSVQSSTYSSPSYSSSNTIYTGSRGGQY